MFKKNILIEKYNNNHKHRCHYTNTFISHMDLEKINLTMMAPQNMMPEKRDTVVG